METAEQLLKSPAEQLLKSPAEQLLKLALIISFIKKAKEDNWMVEQLENTTFEFTKETDNVDLNFFLKKNLGLI